MPKTRMVVGFSDKNSFAIDLNNWTGMDLEPLMRRMGESIKGMTILYVDGRKPIKVKTVQIIHEQVTEDSVYL